jgi:hypothetical protein
MDQNFSHGVKILLEGIKILLEEVKLRIKLECDQNRVLSKTDKFYIKFNISLFLVSINTYKQYFPKFSKKD